MPLDPEDDRESCHILSLSGTPRLPPGVAPGKTVLVRGTHRILESSVSYDDCVALTLRSALDERAILLWPFDRAVPVEREVRVRAVRPRRWISTISGNAAAARRAGGLRVPGASRLEILPYQIAPALAVVDGVCRMFLADEVGLGKTIQAGWIIADAMARVGECRVLIAVPAGLKRQWLGELASLFEIAACDADARWLRSRAADLPPDLNPWSLPGVYLASLDFLKRPEVRRAVERLPWDVLVVDEVHSAAAPTDRHAALESIAGRSRVVVLITATPFSGDPLGFASIARLGRAGGEDPILMFRRSREIRGRPRRHRFATVRVAAAERRLQRLLERYSREAWREAAGGEGARLAMTVLRKRALSSAEAVGRSLDRRLALLQRSIPLPQQLDLFAGDEACEDEEPLAALAAPGLADQERERRWLAALADAARTAQSVEGKPRFLRRLLRRLGGEAAIVFTEYRDTLVRLAGWLDAANPPLLLHGGMSAEERGRAQRQFNERGGLLLATDAASEGLNLQDRCRLVINYELPWNPARLEQRIGRVDRIGQRRPVHAITLVARDTAEDLVLANLLKRLARVASTLGERDRLAAFLTDARSAQMIIGGRRFEWAAERESGDLDVDRDVGAFEAHAAVEARRLEEWRALTWRARRPRRPSPAGDVLVSSVPARIGLPPGFVFMIHCWTSTAEGDRIDESYVGLHVSEGVEESPRAAREARRAATQALGRHREAIGQSARGFVARRSAERRSGLDAAILRLVARERALQGRVAGRQFLQPGLFDGRALRAQGEEDRNARAVAAAHERRIAALEAQRALRDQWRIAGILIVARGPAR